MKIKSPKHVENILFNKLLKHQITINLRIMLNFLQIVVRIA